MTTYSPADRLAEIQKQNFANPLTALSISLAEFPVSRDANAQAQSDVIGPNGRREDSWGPWQLNLGTWGPPSNLFPSGVTQACAMDLACSTGVAHKISQGGTDFGDWSAFKNGSYKKFLTILQGLLPPSTSGSDSGPKQRTIGPVQTIAPWRPAFFDFPVTGTFGAPTVGSPGVRHLGTDFATPLGTPVQAAGVGTVERIFSDQLGGHQVQVKYAQGGTGWFAHLNDVIVNIGDKVNPSTVVAHSGATGNVTGPHLHFQLLDASGQSVDPQSGAFSELVTRNGTFAASGDCPAGWHRGGMGGAGFCVPDGLKFGGGDLGKNLEDAGKAVTPDPITFVRNTLGTWGQQKVEDIFGAAVGTADSGAGGGSGGGDFFGVKSQDLWRIGFVVLGVVAIFIGGRMYFHESAEVTAPEVGPSPRPISLGPQFHFHGANPAPAGGAPG